MIAGIAIVVSLASLVLTLRASERAALRARKPILVFEYGSEGWVLRNIGSGPALNVVVARSQPKGSWFDPVRVPPLGGDDSVPLHWCAHDNVNALGARYDDYEGTSYTTTCGGDLSRVAEGDQIHPSTDVVAHWKKPDAET